jgi:sensor domain CHASE-containing protein
MREVTSVVVAIVLVALVVGAVFGIYFLVFSGDDSDDVIEEEPEVEDEINVEEVKTYEDALQSGNINNCDLIVDELARLNCREILGLNP